MQFKVPQFLEIEDKIFGPFTFREFVYLAGGAGMCFVLYKLLGLAWGALPILIIGSFAGALTFYRPNNKPFINMIESGFKYFTQDKLYIWKKHKVKKEDIAADKAKGFATQMQGYEGSDKAQAIPIDYSRLTGSKLRDLAWSLDVLDLSKKQSDS